MQTLYNFRNIIDSLKKTYNKNYSILIVIISSFMFIFFIRASLAMLDSVFVADEYPIQRIVFTICSTVLVFGLDIGFIKLILNSLENKPVSINYIFHYFHLLGKYIQGLLLFYLIMLIFSIPALLLLYFVGGSEIFTIIINSIGDPYFQELINSYIDMNQLLIVFIMIIIPFLYLSIRLLFWNYFIIDQNNNGYMSIIKSWKLTKNKELEILSYIFILLIINIIGLLSIVGMCFTIPFSYVFLCKYYQILNASL